MASLVIRSRQITGGKSMAEKIYTPEEIGALKFNIINMALAVNWNKLLVFDEEKLNQLAKQECLVSKRVYSFGRDSEYRKICFENDFVVEYGVRTPVTKSYGSKDCYLFKISQWDKVYYVVPINSNYDVIIV